MTINACIVGYGLSAKIFHLPFLLSTPSFTLHSIIQRTPPSNPTKKGESAPHDFPNVTHYRDIDSALANPDINLIIITSIPSTHYEFTKKALEKGKHVLVEKPFVPTAKEADELARLAAEKGLVLSVYQNRRWDSDFLTLKSLLDERKLGRVVEVESHFDRHRPTPTLLPSDSASSTGKEKENKPLSWKNKSNEPASGALFDLGTHLLDQLTSLFGVPSSITAFITNQRRYPEGSVGGDLLGGDSFTVIMQWKEYPGLLGTAKAGVISPLQKQMRFLVKGEEGSWVKQGMDVQEAQLHAGLRPKSFAMPGCQEPYFNGDGASESYGVEEESKAGIFTSAEGQEGRVEPVVKTYCEFYRLLGEAIEDKGKVPVSAEEAANVLRVVEAALVSSREGRTVLL